MKKVISLLISVCMLISIVPTFVSAAEAGTTFTAGDFTYKVNTDTTTVTLTSIAATKLTGAVTVPATGEVYIEAENYRYVQYGNRNTELQYRKTRTVNSR